MSFDLETLYKLLPAIYRIRDLEQPGNGLPFDSLQGTADNNAMQLPLKALLEVIAEQIAVLERTWLNSTMTSSSKRVQNGPSPTLGTW